METFGFTSQKHPSIQQCQAIGWFLTSISNWGSDLWGYTSRSPSFLCSLCKVCGAMQNQQRRLMWMTGALTLLIVTPGWANQVEASPDQQQMVQQTVSSRLIPAHEVRSLDEIDQPMTTVSEWLDQIAQAANLQITGVRLEAIETGLEVVLETEGQFAEPSVSVVGNAWIADIPNAVLVLSEADEFQSANPVAGIALVSITNLPNNRVRVAITGVDASPTVNLNMADQGWVLAITPTTEAAEPPDSEEAIQVVVTGEQDDGYILPETPDVFRLNAPLRDLPRSIQVVPQAVIADQAATRLRDAVRNVSGVVQSGGFAGTVDQLNIRGFFSQDILRDGFRGPFNINETSNIERIEILKGPASILFGNIEPGGIVNIVTEQPLSVPYYAAELEIGSFGQVRPSIDLSGPLTADGAVRYRLNAAYEHFDGFRDFDQDVERYFVSPVLAIDIGENTDLVLDFSYLNDTRPFDRGLLAIGRDIVDVPIRRFFGEPNDFREVEEISASYRLNHQLSAQWGIRSAFGFTTVDDLDFRAEPLALDEATGLLSRNFRSNDDLTESYVLQNEIQGRFTTGSLNHRLLFGVDLTRQTFGGTQRRLPEGLTPDLDIFDPEYDQIPIPNFGDLTNVVRNNFDRTDSLGIYVQDLIELTSDLRLLLAGRFDFVEQRNRDRLSRTTSGQDVEAFSPTIGLLYQPNPSLSLYANFARSFQPNFGTQSDGSFIDPERGTQFEIGVRGEFLQGDLTAGLALYRITKFNVATTDPDNPDFTISAGEQRSQGIELDVIGQILPGWNVIASYSYIDAEITAEVFGLRPGSRIQDVPEHTGSFWTTYEIQEGDLQGLGFGIGLFLVGERAGDFEDTFDLPSYLRTDAAVFYQRDRWRAAVNIQNLFDIDYFISNNFGRVAIEPGAPLSVIGSVSVEF